jgi:hypothetical protein
MKAYILYIDTPQSNQYMNECVESMCKFPDLEPIPVLGETGLTYDGVCESYGFRKHPWRMDKSLEDFPGVFDVIASVDASHFKIWKMIIDSGEPGIVLEHKAIVKGPVSDIEIKDYEIVHYGPRIQNIDDYEYPESMNQTKIPVESWEGVHAYGLTPRTAQHLFKCLDEKGYLDSTDPMLAFRNIYDLNLFTIDPPPIVVANGGRQSTYTPSKVSAFWNAYHTKNYLANVKPGADIATLRQRIFSDRSFDQIKPRLSQFIEKFLEQKNDILVVNGFEGYEALWLGNHLLDHDESRMYVLTSTKYADLCKYNLYFCWNYTKVRTIAVEDESDLLINATDDSDIQYDVIFYRMKSNVKAVLCDVVTLKNLIKPNGIIILDNISKNSKAIELLKASMFGYEIFENFMTLT